MQIVEFSPELERVSALVAMWMQCAGVLNAMQWLMDVAEQVEQPAECVHLFLRAAAMLAENLREVRDFRNGVRRRRQAGIRRAAIGEGNIDEVEGLGRRLLLPYFVREGGRLFHRSAAVVQHLIAPGETAFCDTDTRMRP